MKIIGFKGVLKVFYYLMAIDGVTDVELDRFKEIGQELMGNKFDSICNETIGLCNVTLESIDSEENRFDSIQGAIDDALKHQVYDLKFGVVPRLILWDMISIAYSDGAYTEEENRLIGHVARILEVDKSVLVEMKQLMITGLSIYDEQTELEKSERPYCEVKPLIDELEKRKCTIIEAVNALIEDDLLVNTVELYGERYSKALSAANKLKQTVTPFAISIAQKTQEGIKAGSKIIKEKVKKISDKPEFILPTIYEKADDELKQEVGYDPEDNIYCMCNDNTVALIQFKHSVSDEPFDYDEQSLIDFLHESIDKDNDDTTGIVDVKGGITKSGGQYLIQILKQSVRSDNGFHTGNRYLLELYIEKNGEDQLVEGTFVESGTTGLRESMVMAQLQNEGLLDDFPEGWSADPYDPDFKKGFLMNLAEQEKYDKYFVTHPLSEARKLAKFIVGTN